MKSTLLAGILALAFVPVVSSTPADAKGCIKGALAGGVAGHFAGHHAILGAIGGCFVGHHLANEKDKQQQRAAAQNTHPEQAPNTH